MDFGQYDLTKFKKGAGEFGIELSARQAGQFIQYYELLMEWNSFMNLTAITAFEEVCTKHFIDSISLCRVLDCTEAYSIIDVGTGAGFPGIPLKIVFPGLKITLLDSLGKRVKFLNEVIARLELGDTEAVHGRAEEYARPGFLRETFDVCVSRAVANLAALSEYCLPFVKTGGYFIPYKSEKVLDELQAAGKAISVLGGVVEKQNEFMLPQSDIYRNLITIRKERPTPQKYPRKAGMPSKEPLS